MHIFDLPLELLHEILATSIQVRGLKRGLRLRLVNSKTLLVPFPKIALYLIVGQKSSPVKSWKRSSYFGFSIPV